MGIRERILMPLDQHQQIVFSLFFGVTLLGNIGFELYSMHSYHPHLLHLGALFAIILTVRNPQGVRLLLFGFFVFLMMKIFQIPIHSNDAYGANYTIDQCLIGFVLYFLTSSLKIIVYVHIALYAILAYFSFKNPFVKKVLEDSEVIDDFS